MKKKTIIIIGLVLLGAVFAVLLALVGASQDMKSIGAETSNSNIEMSELSYEYYEILGFNTGIVKQVNLPSPKFEDNLTLDWENNSVIDSEGNVIGDFVCSDDGSCEMTIQGPTIKIGRQG